MAVFLETDGDRVIQLAERLRASVESQAIKVTGSDHVLRCTVTIGVLPPFYGAHGLEDAFRQADAALYTGKAGGRNRIELADVFTSVLVENSKAAIM